MKRIRFCFSILSLMVYSASVKANCELSWVKETEKDQNWIHTVATYPPIIRHAYVAPELTGKKMEFACTTNNQGFCENVKRMKFGSKSCELVKPNKIIPTKKSEIEEGIEVLPTWQTVPCKSLPVPNTISVVGKNNEMNFLEPYPLSSTKQTSISQELEKQIREIPELRKVKLSEFPPIEADLSQMPLKTFALFSNPLLKEDSVAEVKIAVKMNQIPTVCEKDCKDPNQLIEIPVIFLKNGSKWKLLGNGMIGTCSAYNGDSEPSLEIKFNKPFGLPFRYIFYDTNSDGKPDTLQLSSRTHLPGTVTLYDLLSDGSIEVGGELCIKSIGSCFPKPGC